jgi:hypothetical protein
MKHIITDDMLDTFVPCGRYDEIADIILERYRGISGIINFPMPENPAHDMAVADIIATLQSSA